MKNSTWKAEPSGACAVTDDGFELTIFATRSATWKGEKWRGVVRHIAVDGRAPVELFTNSFIEKAAAQQAVLVKLAEIRQRATEGLCLFLDKEPEKPRESSTGRKRAEDRPRAQRQASDGCASAQWRLTIGLGRRASGGKESGTADGHGARV